MADKFAVIETPSVEKRKENTLAIINDDPERVYQDKKSLEAIYEITQFINSKRKRQGRQYVIRFKLFKSEDKSLYEDECNRIISQNVSANEFKTVRDFAIWYKEYSKKIVQEIEIDDKVQDYIVENRKRPHK